MDITELTPIVTAMQTIITDANVKRADFKAREITNLEEQSLGEVLGAGKCLQVLISLYPAEMEILTSTP